MSQLIVLPNSGISNRLKSLISASLLGDAYKVYWPPELFCGLRYADIFCDISREVDHIQEDSLILNTWRFELPMELRNLLPTGFSDCSTGYKGIDFPGDNQARTIDFEYLKIPQPILSILKKKFAQLHFSEEIWARVNAQLLKMPDQYVGVHARTWINEPDRIQKWFNFDDFVKTCSRFQDKELFVTSDDPGFIEKLSRSLNKKLIIMNRSEQRVPKPWQQNSREEMLDDVVELLVLSRASQLVLTAMSTYSEVAWFFGGCTEDVYFADPDFQHKGHTGGCLKNAGSDGVEIKEYNVNWIEIAGNPPYWLALIPGHHLHLDHLNEGAYRIGDYAEKYSGYMRSSAPEDYMIDVGANIGLSAFPVAAIQRRVVAFEPVAGNVEAMKKSILRNRFDKVTLVECAISSQVGHTNIYVPLGRADNTSFGKDVANANVSSPEVHQFKVLTETLDHWFEKNNKEFSPGNAKLLKIDVQGYETAVLLGAKHFIAACRPFEKLVIEFEFDPKLTKMAGYSIVALLDLIHSYGLEIYYNNAKVAPDDYADFCRQGINCDLIAMFHPEGDSEQGGNNSISNLTTNAGKKNVDDSMYGQAFYNSQILGSLQSAQVYLYHLFSIWGVPESVADLGCGRGAWLATCRDLGVKRVVGFDGGWNSQRDMLDPNIEFYPANLEMALPRMDTFDLAISLEVAEHLPPESSDTFIESLSGLSDAVLFGAAFIGQPGANHINTRPHSFWARKFIERGYALFDLFRPLFWNDDRVEPCYRQNTFLYVKPGHNLYLVLVDRGYACNRDARFIDCVHPAIYLGLLNEFNRLQSLGANPEKNLPQDQCGSVGSSAALPDDPRRIEGLIEHAQAQVALNQLDEAAHSYRLALAQEPNNPECLLRLSYLLLRTKNYEACFHHARHFLRIASDVAFGYYLAGHAAREIGRWREARSYLLRAVELDPSHVFAGVLCCMSSFTVCMNEEEARSILQTYNAELGELIRTTGLETSEQINNAVYGIGALSPFFLPYLGYDVKDLQVTYGAWICSIMAAKYPQFMHALPVKSSIGKIKIGIVSNYFHNHSNWKIPIRGWLDQLDRQRFSIHCFYTGGVDDTATESARSLADYFLQSNDVETLTTALYEQAFDVLIYPGIGMDTVTLKLAALRLAPVQCASWGHPVTTGMATVDYYISSDLMEPPDGDEHYSENLVRLPNLSVWYEPGETNGAAPGDLVIPGLLPQDVLFLCCQNLLKYLPRHDLIFPAIARQSVNARFVFIASHVPELTEKFMQRINLVFQGRGLNAADHVIVLPQLGQDDFSALNARADIFLDSIEWSGCNTVFESLPFNKPIVTLPGQFMRGRHAYAILKMMGVEDTIATSVDEYISIAVRLALDTHWRDDVSGRICRNKHRIYQDRECITAMEHFLMRVSGRGAGGADAIE